MFTIHISWDRELLVSRVTNKVESGADLALHFHWSGVLGDRLSSQYESFTQKIVLRRPFISHIQEDLALYIYCSGLLGDGSLN